MDTMDRVKVVINIDRVAQNLRTADGTNASEAGATAFLRRAGFNPDPNGAWVGTRAGLRRLNHSEVVRVEPLG